jgi:hypothetical protein
VAPGHAYLWRKEISHSFLPDVPVILSSLISLLLFGLTSSLLKLFRLCDIPHQTKTNVAPGHAHLQGKERPHSFFSVVPATSASLISFLVVCLNVWSPEIISLMRHPTSNKTNVAPGHAHRQGKEMPHSPFSVVPATLSSSISSLWFV